MYLTCRTLTTHFSGLTAFLKHYFSFLFLFTFAVFPRFHQPVSVSLTLCTHRVDVDEEAMLVLGRIKSMHIVQQLWVAVEEVRLGDEHRRACRSRWKRVVYRAGHYDGIYRLNGKKKCQLESSCTSFDDKMC